MGDVQFLQRLPHETRLRQVERGVFSRYVDYFAGFCCIEKHQSRSREVVARDDESEKVRVAQGGRNFSRKFVMPLKLPKDSGKEPLSSFRLRLIPIISGKEAPPPHKEIGLKGRKEEGALQ